MCCRYHAVALLSAILHIAVRLQTVRPSLFERRWRWPWHSRFFFPGRHAGRLRRPPRLAIPPACDLGPSGSAPAASAPGRHVPSGSVEFQFPEAFELDERGVWLPFIHYSLDVGSGRQSVLGERYTVLQSNSRYHGFIEPLTMESSHNQPTECCYSRDSSNMMRPMNSSKHWFSLYILAGNKLENSMIGFAREITFTIFFYYIHYIFYNKFIVNGTCFYYSMFNIIPPPTSVFRYVQ